MSPTLELRHVSFAFGATPLFDDLSLCFGPGWTGITGPNGAGKTTLLRLIAGELRPTAGRIAVHPDALYVHRFPQVITTPAHLSPGERRGAALAALMANAPEVLLLDEPEGHLDEGARAHLVATLRRYRGIGLLVAHDRELLDALTTTTVEVGLSSVRSYPGPYSAARAAWDEHDQGKVSARAELRARRSRAARTLDAARRETQAAARQKSAGARMRNRHDSDARAIGATTLADWANRSLGKGVARARGVLDTLDLELAETRSERRLDPRSLGFELRPTPQRLLMGGDLRAALPAALAASPYATVWFGRDDRVHLAGPNGAGKSTLLRALLGTACVPAESLLVMPQELSEAVVEQALAQLRATTREQRGRVFQLVAALGASPERLLASAAPSPGEARKLHLALGLARGVAALVLDEPTNHLDLPSVERLQAALSAWPGALLIATHDARLAAVVTRTTWRLAPRSAGA